MGRAGSGRAGGGRSGGSRSSGSRSGGSHRMSSGSRSYGGTRRAGSGNYSRGNIGGPSHGPRGPMGPGGPHIHIGPRMPHRRIYHTSTYYGGGSLIGIICLIAFISVFICLFANSSPKTQTNISTIKRTKLETEYGYDNNNVIDEIGWIENKSKLSSNLKDFYNETGVQPYIVLLDYDETLSTDSEKEDYAYEYFDENELNENGFLFMYFAEKNVDEDVGLMMYVNGYQASSVMDSEAVEIFWNNIDEYWYTNLSTDDMFVKAFNDTANTIMTVSKTKEDVTHNFITFLIVIAVIGGIITFVVIRNKRKKEEAEETRRILETPLDKMENDNDLINN